MAIINRGCLYIWVIAASIGDTISSQGDVYLLIFGVILYRLEYFLYSYQYILFNYQ